MARKKTWEWENHLTQVLSAKPTEVVQEACQVLGKHGCPVKKLKSELYYSSTHCQVVIQVLHYVNLIVAHALTVQIDYCNLHHYCLRIHSIYINCRRNYGTSYKNVSILLRNTPLHVPEQCPYSSRTTSVAVPIPYYATAILVRNEADAKRTECKSSLIRALTFKVLVCSCTFLYCSNGFQCIFPVSQRMVYSDYVK